MPVFHDDVLDLLRGLPEADEVRWVMLRDHVVECGVQIRCLDPGSLDALPAALLATLESASPRTLDDLTKAVRGGPIARQAVSEVLAVLERINEVSVDYRTDGQPEFKSSPGSRLSGMGVQERLVEKSFRYVPRSGELGLHIPGMMRRQLRELRTAEEFSWWTPPDEETIYAEEALLRSIKAACAALYRVQTVFPDFEVEDTRLEVLQRSRLVSPKLSFLDAVVLNAMRTHSFVIHRCYLCRSTAPGAHTWGIRVHRYRRGPQQEGYTQYLRSRARESPAILDSLLAVSQPCRSHPLRTAHLESG